ncbi:MAG: hypothetical protein M1819_005294 [Sarea resinae]|nr:MAG: hypothetical protein M1819_005294 [Sarea resinae]
MLQLDEEEVAPLKKWVVKRLEDISDADSDVLADYVLALVRSEAPDEEVKSTSRENLEDFLKDHTANFVDDIFNVINTKSYLPGQSAPNFPPSASPPFNPPSGPANVPYGQPTKVDGNGLSLGRSDQSRKRSYNDHEQSEPGDPHYGRSAGGERSFKQMRRGGTRGGRADRVSRQGFQNQDVAMGGVPGLPRSPSVAFPGMPPLPPGFPFDPNDPMGAIMAMQAMGFPPLPGMPPFPQAGSPTDFVPTGQRPPGADVPPANKINERCKDYDQKGYCALGSTCPYEHGTDHIIVPGQSDEYDPSNSSIMTDVRKTSNGANGFSPHGNSTRGGDRGRGRGRGRGDHFNQRGRGRAEFSHAGPNHDRSITTIVVEQIPEEKFNEEAVREFFSEFGNIDEVAMQAYKRLALVKFDDWSSAKRAYDSPKVIFDNRFVKVYWYKPDSVPTPPVGAGRGSQPPKPEEPKIDLAEFEKKQADVQKAHEEKMKKIKETESAKEALEKRREELLRSQQEEKKKLMERLAKAGKASSGSPSAAGTPVPDGKENEAHAETPKSSAQTEALRAQLAALEAEAKSLGLDTALPDDSSSRGGRGGARGSYRGRGGFVPRARGYYPSYRGGYVGRGGAPRGGARGGVAYKLDNRTKKVAVSGVEFDTTKDESLRQYLLGIGEFENIEANPDRKDSQIITFKDRGTAEKFMYSGKDIPSVGKVDFSWINTPLPPISVPTSTSTSASKPQPPPQQHQQQQQQQAEVPSATNNNNDGDAAMADHDAADGAAHRNADVDYDVADDEDRWMVS